MIHLSQANSSIIFEDSDETLSILHWGEKIGELTPAGQAALSKQRRSHIFMALSMYRPAILYCASIHVDLSDTLHLRGHRSGVAASNRFVLKSATQNKQSLVATFVDEIAELEIAMTYSLTPSDVLLIDATVTNKGSSDYFLEHFLYWLPLAEQADQSLDFYGHWTKERQPQRRDIGYGLTSREGFEGRSGHDYTITQIALSHRRISVPAQLGRSQWLGLVTIFITLSV
jgi:alpha-galactosidase